MEGVQGIIPECEILKAKEKIGEKWKWKIIEHIQEVQHLEEKTEKNVREEITKK